MLVLKAFIVRKEREDKICGQCQEVLREGEGYYRVSGLWGYETRIHKKCFANYEKDCLIESNDF